MKTGRIALLVLSLTGSGCPAPWTPDFSVPEAWHRLPEDAEPDRPVELADLPEAGAGLVERVDQVFHAQGHALERTAPAQASQWGLRAFMTDLTVSTSGVLGALTAKGTPSVTTVWRRQAETSAPPEPTPDAEAAHAIQVDSEDSPAELQAQVEPWVEVASASGRVRNPARLRDELSRAVFELAGLAGELARGDAAQGGWWFSRLRSELSIEASGKVSPGISAGAEMRLRFEWFRIRRSGALAKSATTESPSHFGRFASALAEDLAAATEEWKDRDAIFDPHSFRVGLGFTAKGDLAIVKAQSTAIAHAYFSRNAQRPVVNPPPATFTEAKQEVAPLLLAESADLSGPTPPGKLAGNPAIYQHLGYARSHSIGAWSFARTNSVLPEEAVFEIDRRRFRRGLGQALKMGRFFAARAERAHLAHWKVHELKVGFDLSMTGKLGLAELGGVAAAEISFFNTRF